MALTESAQVAPGGTRLLLTSWYHCQASIGIDVLAEDAADIGNGRVVGLKTRGPTKDPSIGVVPGTRPFVLNSSRNRQPRLCPTRPEYKWVRVPGVITRTRPGREYVCAKRGMQVCEVDVSWRTSNFQQNHYTTPRPCHPQRVFAKPNVGSSMCSFIFPFYVARGAMRPRSSSFMVSPHIGVLPLRWRTCWWQP